MNMNEFVGSLLEYYTLRMNRPRGRAQTCCGARMDANPDRPIKLSRWTLDSIVAAASDRIEDK